MPKVVNTTGERGLIESRWAFVLKADRDVREFVKRVLGEEVKFLAFMDYEIINAAARSAQVAKPLKVEIARARGVLGRLLDRFRRRRVISTVGGVIG